MSSYTPIHNRFWSDSWVRGLNALDRYLFLYLLTNGRSARTGIYELPLDMLGAECGIDEKDLQLSMLPRLEPKVFYREGWVIIISYPKHLIGDGPKFWAGVRNEFNEIPTKIRELAIGYGYPIDTLSIPYSRFSNRIDNNIKDISANADFVIEDEKNTDRKVPSSVGGLTKAQKAGYEAMLRWAEAERGFKFINRLKQYKALKIAKGAGLTSKQLKERWQEMAEKPFYQEEGFDWQTVVSSFNKKA